MLTAALCRIAKKKKQLKCPSTHRWIKIWGTSIQQNIIQPLKGDEVLIHATTWMNLENVMPNGSQVTKGYILYDFIYMKYP